MKVAGHGSTHQQLRQSIKSSKPAWATHGKEGGNKRTPKKKKKKKREAGECCYEGRRRTRKRRRRVLVVYGYKMI
jgi:hypothetical protein